MWEGLPIRQMVEGQESKIIARLGSHVAVVDMGYKTPCHLWTAGLCEDGYAKVKIAGRVMKGHRVIYELMVEPIGAGLVLDHLCRVRPCINWEHLEPVTIRVNTKRGAAGVLRTKKAKKAV